MDIWNKSKKVIEETNYKADSVYNKVTEEVFGTFDSIADATTKAKKGAIELFGAMAGAGLAIGLAISPVPVCIGLALLLLVDTPSMSSATNSEDLNRGEKRRINKAISMLKKHGKVPSTAIVQTDFLKMEINSVTGKVNGVILSGEFSGADLKSFSQEDIERLMSFSRDQETYSLLEAYLSFRKRSENA